MQNSSIEAVDPNGVRSTLLRDPWLRWPDGFSFGPDGWLYVTCSALQRVLFRNPRMMRQHAPYQIFRFQPGPMGIAGH